ncbi:Arc family DNA-binding protein [Delftia sp. 60]|uniref:Arc family DNA-binding protein n=1 Tax=Delftia sp. 60 TaxID=2035216 RepID=UPI000C1A8857|nr:Arc family DNA-binding protein [Delftia sp. 60]
MATDRHQAPSYPLRMPDELKARIQASANESGRSLHAELLHRLESSYKDDDTIKLLKNNVVLLRTLASFVLLQQNHPEVMEPMRESMIAMAKAIKETDDDAKVLAAAKPSFLQYVEGLVQSVDRVTELLGEGWASKANVDKTDSKP